MSAQDASSNEVQSLNWSGSIPVILQLAPTSLSAPTMPSPLHVLVARTSFLHVALESAVMRLYKFAPASLSFASGMVQNEPEAGLMMMSQDDDDGGQEVTDTHTTASTASQASVAALSALPSISSSPTTYPVCWFEDEDTSMALRWHVFAGVLFDLKPNVSRGTTPWKIRLHFTAYPNSQILPLEQQQSGNTTTILKQVQHYYTNSLKQALCLQYGNSKPAMNMTRDSHGKLWEAIRTTNYSLYASVSNDLLELNNDIVPLRVYWNDRPPIQKSCFLRDENGNDRTLGDVLLEWLPLVFTAVAKSAIEGHTTTSTTAAVVATTDYCCRISGISVALETPLANVWSSLAHPDHFCYVAVTTMSSGSSPASKLAE
jgi:hypothetical protein